MRYLCMYYHIHTIPIGSDYTQKNLETIKNHIPKIARLYTSTHCYTFTKSRYSGKVNSSSSEVDNSYWLDSSVDASKIQELEQKKAQVLEHLANLQAVHKENTERREEITKKAGEIKTQMATLREKRQYIENLSKKYQINLKRYQALEAEKITILADAENKARFVCDLAKKRVKLFADYADSAQSLLLLNKDKLLGTYHESKFVSERRKLEAELREYMSKLILSRNVC